ncbi:hypothetical protein GEMRC1_012068 [Eukaryota sp. GEM-RC1]
MSIYRSLTQLHTDHVIDNDQFQQIHRQISLSAPRQDPSICKYWDLLFKPSSELNQCLYSLFIHQQELTFFQVLGYLPKVHRLEPSHQQVVKGVITRHLSSPYLTFAEVASLIDVLPYCRRKLIHELIQSFNVSPLQSHYLYHLPVTQIQFQVTSNEVVILNSQLWSRRVFFNVCHVIASLLFRFDSGKAFIIAFNVDCITKYDCANSVLKNSRFNRLRGNISSHLLNFGSEEVQ